MNITRDWVSSFVMLCQAFTAADFSYCLFVGLSAFSFVFSEWNAFSIRLQSGDWLGHCRIFHFFAFKNSWVAFAVCFGSSSICTMKRRPINFAAFGWIWAASISLYTSEFFHLLLSSVTSSINTSNPEPLEAMHAHASHCSTMFHRWCCMLWIRGHQTWSWRTGVLHSLAPTWLNTPAWNFQAYLVRPWLAGSGVFD